MKRKLKPTATNSPKTETDTKHHITMNATIEITREAFHAIIENEQNCFVGNEVKELAEITTFESKGMTAKTIYNFVSNVKQYYLVDINA